MCNCQHLTMNDIEIIVIILFIAFMQGIYNYIPETNHVSRVYSVAAVLYLQLCYTECYFTCEICFVLLHQHFPAVCVQCSLWLFLCFLNFVLSCYVAQVFSE